MPVSRHRVVHGGDGILVDGEAGSVHMGFGILALAGGDATDWHVHSYEESYYVLDGELVCETGEGASLLRAGDYGVVAVGAAHALRNGGAAPVRWAQMCAPQPRTGDTFTVPGLAPLGQRAAMPVDPRDPRTRSFGHIDPEHSDPALQTQDRLAVSASMRTALLVYSGITVKMMVDSDLGAQLSTMFMVAYEPGGYAGAHDHPFEEAYLILEGEVDARFDGEAYHLVPGDVAFAGVGCVHEFANTSSGRVRWLETQAPQPPARHSYRFARDWEYLRSALDRTARQGAT